MNKDILTTLGCSGSLAFILLANNPAKASPFIHEYNGYTGNTITAQTGTPVLQKSSQQAVIDPGSDTVGDMAVAKFGCDCMACRNKIVAMLQTTNSLLR